MATCFNVLRGKRIRITKLDDCCAPPASGTACSVVTSSGFISVGYSAEVESGTEITVKNADGGLCINDRSCDQFKRWNLELELCEVDPDLMAIMVGLNIETDYAGEAVGFRTPEGQVCNKFGFELWTGIPGIDCDPAQPDAQYGYVLLPCVTGGVIGDFTIEEAATTFSVSAYTDGGGTWGQGPYDVIPQDAANTPGPLLTPMDRKEHMLLRTTTIAPPDAVCGCVAMP